MKKQQGSSGSKRIRSTASPEQKTEILKARAVALAREPEEQAEEERIELVEFLLAAERYGIESSYVREVYPLRQFTPLPCTPPFVLGIVNVRGQIVSVIDIKRVFDLPERGLTELNKVIIIRDDLMEFGILADSILGVRPVSLKDIQPSLPTLTGIRQEYLRGVTSGRIVILDARKLLSERALVVNAEVES